MKPSDYTLYFEAIATNHKGIEHPVSGGYKRFVVITNPPRDMYTGQWTNEFTNALKAQFQVNDKAGMVLEMYVDKLEERSAVDIRSNAHGAFIILKKPVDVKRESIESVWDECREIAHQVMGYIVQDARNKIHNNNGLTTPFLELGETYGAPVSDVNNLFGWRLEFEFMQYVTAEATYDDQFWNTPLAEFP